MTDQNVGTPMKIQTALTCVLCTAVCASLEISVGSVEFHIFPLYMSIYIVASILQIRQ